MHTFVASEKVVGAALALSPSGRITETQLGQLETFIYTRAPQYTILFSSESVNSALSTYRSVFHMENDESFVLADGENSKRSAINYFVNTLEDHFLSLMREYFDTQME